MNDYKTRFHEKLREALMAVLPIVGLVLLLSFTIVPIPNGILLAFLIGAILLIFGMMLFTLGAELAMSPMGEKMGTKLAGSRKLHLVVLLCFSLGFLITISEPDLQVLAQQVPAIPNMTLILAVAFGVGCFLVLAMIRMLFSVSLSHLLILFYAIIFLLACFVPKDFLAVAFDSGGVTTGPMTVPFIMALGVGFSAIRSDEHAQDDSFGLVSLCSIGPILAVLLLGLFYHPSDAAYESAAIINYQDSIKLWRGFAGEFPLYLKEIAVSLLPIALFFFVFHLLSLHLQKKSLLRIVVGLVYTYAGLVLFLTGVNAGFMPAGNYLGAQLAGFSSPWILIPIAMVIGFFIVKAEPAVYVLMEQVEDITSGAISGKSMGMSLSIGVALSLGLAMIRVLTGISIFWFLVPGYVLALALSFFVPKIFTAIAFDSGGVASGPMTATFLLPFAAGACEALGGNVVTDAFGVVAMVAMTPLITIQLLGVVFRLKSMFTKPEELVPESYLDIWGEHDIIEL